MLKNDSRLLERDKLFYQECNRLLEMLMKHISSADFSKDMVKKVLYEDMQRLSKWVEDELINIDNIQKEKYDNS